MIVGVTVLTRNLAGMLLAGTETLIGTVKPGAAFNGWEGVVAGFPIAKPVLGEFPPELDGSASCGGLFCCIFSGARTTGVNTGIVGNGVGVSEGTTVGVERATTGVGVLFRVFVNVGVGVGRIVGVLGGVGVLVGVTVGVREGVGVGVGFKVGVGDGEGVGI